MSSISRRASGPTRAVGLVAAAGLLLGVAALPASAHPTIGVAAPLVAGQPARLEVLLFGDEGAVTGVDLTFPSSFSLTDARPTQGDVGTIQVAGHVLHLVGAKIPYGTSAYLLVDGTPSTSGRLTVDVVAHLAGKPDFHYPPVVVGAPEATTGGSWIRKPWAAAPVGAVVAAVAGGLFWLRRRRGAGTRSVPG